MQKEVLVSVPVPVVSTVPPKVAWSFELYLYMKLTVPQVSDCCPLGRLIYASYNFGTVRARIMKIHIWIPHGKIADPYFFLV